MALVLVTCFSKQFYWQYRARIGVRGMRQVDPCRVASYFIYIFDALCIMDSDVSNNYIKATFILNFLAPLKFCAPWEGLTLSP